MVEGFVHQNGFSVDYFEVVGSTNDLAMERVRSGGSGNHWIVAGEQNKGRGRHGRVWTSPPGNLYASLTLVNPCSAATGFQLGFVAALSIYSAVEASGADPHLLALKWPNDVLANGAKLSFPKIRAAWIERSMGMNAPVEIKNNGIARRGIFLGLDENGCLLLDQDGQIVRIEAGDVFPTGR